MNAQRWQENQDLSQLHVQEKIKMGGFIECATSSKAPKIKKDKHRSRAEALIWGTPLAEHHCQAP